MRRADHDRVPAAEPYGILPGYGQCRDAVQRGRNRAKMLQSGRTMAQGFQLFQRNCGFYGERTHPEATQLGDVATCPERKREIAHPSPHIGPFATGKLKHRVIAVRHRDEAGRVDRHRPRREVELLPLAGEIVSALSFDLDGRECGRNLEHLAGEPGELSYDLLLRRTNLGAAG